MGSSGATGSWTTPRSSHHRLSEEPTGIATGTGRAEGRSIWPSAILCLDSWLYQDAEKPVFAQAAQKGPHPRRRAGYPSAGWVQVRGVLSSYVAAPRERGGTHRRWVSADGPFSAACYGGGPAPRSKNRVLPSLGLGRSNSAASTGSLSRTVSDRKSTRLNSSHHSISYAVF